MQPQPTTLKHHELTEKIIGVFFDVYNDLGHGFLEEVGLLLNFGLKPQFKCFVFENERKDIRADLRRSAASGVSA